MAQAKSPEPTIEPLPEPSPPEPDRAAESRAPTSEPRCPNCNRLLTNLTLSEAFELFGHSVTHCTVCLLTNFLRVWPGTDIPVPDDTPFPAQASAEVKPVA